MEYVNKQWRNFFLNLDMVPRNLTPEEGSPTFDEVSV